MLCTLIRVGLLSHGRKAVSDARIFQVLNPYQEHIVRDQVRATAPSIELCIGGSVAFMVDLSPHSWRARAPPKAFFFFLNQETCTDPVEPEKSIVTHALRDLKTHARHVTLPGAVSKASDETASKETESIVNCTCVHRQRVRLRANRLYYIWLCWTKKYVDFFHPSELLQYRERISRQVSRERCSRCGQNPANPLSVLEDCQSE